MKIENDVVDVKPLLLHHWNGLKTVETERLLDTFWPEYEALIGTQKGKVVSIEEKGDIPWPTTEEHRKMHGEELKKLRYEVNKRLGSLSRAIKKRAGKKKSHYTPVHSYIGNGKVILWWRFKRFARKAVNGNS